MTKDNVNFDELAQKSFAPGAVEADYERLFAAAFLLLEWHFIAVGEMPNLSPYCALFPDFFGDQPAVAVFTDTERAWKFMAESNTEFGSKNKPINLNYGDLTATISSENLILSIPTGNILDYIEKLIPKGVVKIFFNPNTDSHGFSNDLKIMRPIYEHLKNKNLLTQSADEIISEDTPQKSAETLIVQIKDGLGFPSGFVKASPDTLHLFCRVPPYWVDGGQLKPEYLEKIYAQLFGANWRMGNSDGSHYKILDSYTKIFDAETVKTTNFGDTVNQDNHQFFFYIGDKYDWIRKVTAEEFQSDINAEMQTENPDQISKLIEENADVIADFERENALLSAMIAGSAAGMDAKSGDEKEQAISNMADIFEGVRVEHNMSPKLFRVFIETCLKRRKFLMPTLAFAYFQEDKDGIEKLEQDKELSDDLAKWLIKKAVPGADLLLNETEKESVIIPEKEADEPINVNKNEPEKSDTSAAPFDELSKKAMETNAMEDLNALFGAAFALPEWHFIARGELPNVAPYVASNAAVADNQPMIRAFTDTKRLIRFAKENSLTGTDGSCENLTIPTANIIEYLEGFIDQGAYGIWFNSDTESDGFFIPLKQLRPIKEHLAKLNNLPEETKVNNLPKDTIKTALLLIQDGLGFPSGFVSEAGYRLNVFCRVPESWTDGERLKPESREKIFEFLYGVNWRMGNDDGSHYVVIDSFSKIYDEETVKNTRWENTENTEKDHYRFYLVGVEGAIKSVTVAEFQKEVESSFQPAAKETVSPPPENNLAAFGLRENSDGQIEQLLMIDGEPVEFVRQPQEQQTPNDPVSLSDSVDGKPEEIVTVNRVGSIDFDADIIPLSGDIITMIEDYRGFGEYVTLLRFEPQGISQMTEKIAENSHGACLQIRTFHYLNPKNGVHIGVDSVHSNELLHVRTGSKLILSIELCRNLDNQTAAFYFAIQGAKSHVEKLWDLIELHVYFYGFQLTSG